MPEAFTPHPRMNFAVPRQWEHSNLPLTPLTTWPLAMETCAFTSCWDARGCSWLECSRDTVRANLTTASLPNLAWSKGSEPQPPRYGIICHTHTLTTQSSPNICITEIKRTVFFLQNNLTIAFFADFSVPALHLFLLYMPHFSKIKDANFLEVLSFHGNLSWPQHYCSQEGTDFTICSFTELMDSWFFY